MKVAANDMQLPGLLTEAGSCRNTVIWASGPKIPGLRLPGLLAAPASYWIDDWASRPALLPLRGHLSGGDWDAWGPSGCVVAGCNPCHRPARSPQWPLSGWGLGSRSSPLLRLPGLPTIPTFNWRIEDWASRHSSQLLHVALRLRSLPRGLCGPLSGLGIGHKVCQRRGEMEGC
ncbi:hypothetical protein NDU88_006623 [Pleurodeles waltl]|uniref:Uncharacterized protein n=1 Tax=Pleurodeles waltl TaxID=8319 RepID=A0AAV7UNA8_PLEWA|nr:hypothetical protein NDU88_006623 [Pleurodeles waltl]